MALQRVARIAGVANLNANTRLLDLSLPQGDSLGFVGGQYIIVNTGVPLPGGKLAKRAYSILSSDAEQGKFQIAVKRVGSGPGSNHMHTAPLNTDIPFSGPWGQYLPDDALPRKSTWILATDTGITAALGLVRGTRFAPQRPNARLIWFVESKDYFIPEAFIEEVISSHCREFQIEVIPPVNHAGRLGCARSFLHQKLEEMGRPDTVFLSGDGAVLYPFREDLLSEGLSEGQIRMECFFNNPFRKVPA